MSANFRIVANMTLWERDVVFSFAAMANGGYMGEISFPDKVSVGDIMRKLWRETTDGEDFPLGDLALEIESVKAVMNDTKDGSASLIMFEITVEGVQVGIYFVKDNIRHTEATLFLIKSKDQIKIESLPGVDVRLPRPIRANLSLSLCTGPANFSLGGQAYSYQKGFGFDCYIEIPEVLNNRFAYTYNPDSKQKHGFSSKTKSLKIKKPALPTPSTETLPAADVAQETESKPKKKTAAAKTPFKWNKVNKKIGKVAKIERIGVGWFDPENPLPKENDKVKKKVVVQLDLSVYLSALQISLIGLRIVIDAKKLLKGIKDAVMVESKDLSAKQKLKGVTDAFGISLQGLAVGVETKTVTAGGLFVKQDIEYQGKMYRQYVGGLVLKLSQFELTGIGAYGKIDGFTSLFLYAVASLPNIGPPAFMMEKIALGFGFNRRVIIPEIEDVGSFPLVSLAMSEDSENSNPAEMLREVVPMITEYFPPKKSALFFALGIKFNSFKVLDGFLLLLVSADDKIRFDILGFLVLCRPVDKPVAVIRIALKATVIPDDGIVSVEGRITEGSYLFSKKARLKGGFAFYYWFKDRDKISEGDFVMSIGGYHPNFRKPPHYPSVPRFSLSWRIDNNFSIRAEAYLALTPCFFMLGGRLSAVYKSRKLDVWIEIYANFLVQWKPFAYEAEMGVRISGEYRTRFWDFSFSLGAKVKIWGPEFGGRATVSYKSVEKTVRFGARHRPIVQRVEWHEFKKDLLPPENQIMTMQVTDGKREERKENEMTVNPGNFAMEINSKIPVSMLRKPNDKPEDHGSIGIFPVRKAHNSHSVLDLSVTLTTPAKKKIVNPDLFNLSVRKGKFPAALWSKEDRLSLNTKKTLISAASGLSIRCKSVEKSQALSIMTMPDYTVLSHPKGWRHAPAEYGKGEQKDPVELRNIFGVFKEEFAEEESDFTLYALRKEPECIAAF